MGTLLLPKGKREDDGKKQILFSFNNVYGYYGMLIIETEKLYKLEKKGGKLPIVPPFYSHLRVLPPPGASPGCTQVIPEPSEMRCVLCHHALCCRIY